MSTPRDLVLNPNLFNPTSETQTKAYPGELVVNLIYVYSKWLSPKP